VAALGMRLRHAWGAVRSILSILDRHRSMGIAAEMSFWLFCALIPLSVTAALLLARLPGPAGPSSLLQSILANAPDATRALVRQEISGLARNHVPPSLLNLLVFGWLASSGLHSVYDGFEGQLGINTAWWRKRLWAILGCALLAVGVALLALLGAGFTLISELAPAPVQRYGTPAVRAVAAFAVLYGSVAALYRLGIPRATRAQMAQAPGTLAVVICMGLLSAAYRAYLQTFGDGSEYLAGLSVVVITLTALFLFSLAMLLGLAINQQLPRAVPLPP
jgi:membrane protein